MYLPYLPSATPNNNRAANLINLNMNFSAALLFLLSASTIVTVDAERILHENERVDYEIWAADQSSSISNQTTLGARGGLLWVWKHSAILDQVNNKPLPCKPGATNGPCDIFDIFPGNLAQMSSTGAPTGSALDQLPNFGTWHGIMKDATNMYVAVALFTKGGGYVGIIDARTRGAVALFRATKYNYTGAAAGGDRSVHMPFWSNGKRVCSCLTHWIVCYNKGSWYTCLTNSIICHILTLADQFYDYFMSHPKAELR